MDLFSACIRPMFMAAPGKDLIACDFASIEARVLLWLAQDEDALGVFRRGEDIYCDMASFIYGRPITKKDKAERQLGKTAILGIGYQMGAKKFLETCAKDPDLRALGGPVPAATAERVVNGYREKFALVKRLWTETNRAAVQAVQTRQPVAVGRVKFAVWGGFLHCRLPSGRLLSYCNPYIETVETGSGLREQLGFWSVNSITKKWERTKTYGGKLGENIDQATSRDLMAEAMLRVEAAGYPVVLTVHDEVVSEVDEGFGSVEAYEALMVQTPAWAEGIPVAAEGWRGKRYRK
jgi:DNA polymerase